MMNLSLLSTETMLAHSTEWLEQDELRALLEFDPLGQSILVKVAGAHDRLRKQQHQRTLTLRLVERLRDELEQLDATHDGAARAVYFALTALLHGLSGDERVAAFSQLRDTLFPEGLSVVNRSYLDEAGEAVELEERVTPEMLTLLASVPFADRTLADVYREWIAAGKAIGQHAQQRARIQASLSTDGTAAADIDVRSARRQWVATVVTFLRVLDLLDLPEKARETLVSPLQISVKAALASRSRAPASEPDAQPEPDEQPAPDEQAQPEGEAVEPSAELTA